MCGTISWNDIMMTHGRVASVNQRASTLLMWADSHGCCVRCCKQSNAQRGCHATAGSDGYAAGCCTKAQACGAGRPLSERFCSRCAEFPRSAFWSLLIKTHRKSRAACNQKTALSSTNYVLNFAKLRYQILIPHQDHTQRHASMRALPAAP